MALIVASVLLALGPGSEALLHLTRYTARLAFLIFILAFTSAALATLWPSPATHWIRRNRRAIGLSFALVHFVHLGALVAYFACIGERPGLVTMAGGGAAYVLVAIMAATSNDASVRKLGRTVWRRIHLFGSSYIWLIFMNSYVGRLLSDSPPEPRAIFAVTVGLGVLALLLRSAAWIQRTRGA